jgi:predicted nuclease with TOPRIM domain
MAVTCQLNDVELGRVRDGYPALAEWIARDVDGDTYMFRKFDRLAARNILHLQARLVALEYEIDQLDEQARQSKDPNVKLSSRRWETLMEQAKIPDGLEEVRIQKLDELKVLLREYCKPTLDHGSTQILTRIDETLLLQSGVAGLHKPRDNAVSAFRDYLKGTAYRAETDKPMPLISGRAKAFLDEEDDLVSLAKPIEEDYFSRFFY